MALMPGDISVRLVLVAIQKELNVHTSELLGESLLSWGFV